MRDILVNLVSRLLEYSLILSMSVIVILLAINVFLRYIFGRPIPWAEEISVLMMIWVIFLGAGLIQKNEEHVAITYIFDLFPCKLKGFIAVFGNICVFAILAIHFLSGLNLAKLQMKTFTPALRLSMIYFALAVLVGMISMLLFTFDSTIRRFIKKG